MGTKPKSAKLNPGPTLFGITNSTTSSLDLKDLMQISIWSSWCSAAWQNRRQNFLSMRQQGTVEVHIENNPHQHQAETDT